MFVRLHMQIKNKAKEDGGMDSNALNNVVDIDHFCDMIIL